MSPPIDAAASSSQGAAFIAVEDPPLPLRAVATPPTKGRGVLLLVQRPAGGGEAAGWGGATRELRNLLGMWFENERPGRGEHADRSGAALMGTLTAPTPRTAPRYKKSACGPCAGLGWTDADGTTYRTAQKHAASPPSYPASGEGVPSHSTRRSSTSKVASMLGLGLAAGAVSAVLGRIFAVLLAILTEIVSTLSWWDRPHTTFARERRACRIASCHRAAASHVPRSTACYFVPRTHDDADIWTPGSRCPVL